MNLFSILSIVFPSFLVSLTSQAQIAARPANHFFCTGYSQLSSSKIDLQVMLITVSGLPLKNFTSGYYEYKVTIPESGSQLNASAEPLPGNGQGLNILIWPGAAHSPVDGGNSGRILIESTQGFPGAQRLPAHGWLMNPKTKQQAGYDFFCTVG